ncbi:hypothetical protein K7I13_01800 [Brucepastera parasyntrophica]|uniref:hypothetical protein n=1 Tax=Brucepastera parasyntrophica TaxID=2880008 RepID=UPI00210BC3B8|nr:hypothetical protein [Brucepastera parasyntrophica]ULQ60087.1 hypothetical protein K7I13_01800 [Brucepastera parasyntrophica]
MKSEDDKKNTDSADMESDAERLHFHYNREQRLKNAPESVQKIYTEGYTPNKGFIKGLTANRGLRSILTVIIILCIVIAGIALFSDPEGTAALSGTSFKLKAFLYDETIYITLSCSGNSSYNNETQPLIAVFQGLDTDGLVVLEKTTVEAYSGQELVVRTTMRDYEIKRVHANVSINDEDVSITVTVDRS